MSTFEAFITRGRLLSRLVLVALGGLALSLAVIFGSSPAHADAPMNTFTFESQGTGLFLSQTVGVAGGVSGVQPQQLSAAGFWVTEAAPSHEYPVETTLTQLYSGHCLTAGTGSGAEPGSGQVVVETCNDSPSQDWEFVPSGHAFVLQNVGDPNKVLDGDVYGNIYTYPANGGPYQNWSETQE